MHRYRLARLIAAAAAVLALTTGSAAATVPGTGLSLHGYGRMLADPAHNHVFVTGDASDSTILVRNVDGTAAGAITGESGAAGMALDPNTGTLYVARCGWGVIDTINTATLTNTGSIPAGNIGGACDVALAGGVLWYTNTSSHLVSVTLDPAHATADTGELIDGPLASVPTHPTWLVGVFSEAYVKVYDVSDPTAPTLTTSVFSPNGGDAINDIATTPDGNDLLIASGAPYELQVLSLPGLTPAGVYPTGPYPNAAAVSPDGSLYAAGTDSMYAADVHLYSQGTATVKHTWDFGSSTDLLYPRGLVFADATHIFAVSKGAAGTGVVLHVLSTVTLPKGSVSVKTSAATVLAGHALTVTAHLGTASTNKTVSIYRKPANGTRVLVKTGTVGAKGNLAVTVRPTATTTYTAVWAGDAAHAQTTSAAATTKVRLVVHAATQGGYRTASGVRLYHYHASCAGKSHTGCPTFLTSSTPLLAGHQVNLTVQTRSASGAWHTSLTGSHRTGANGKLVVIIYYNGRAVIGVPERIRFTYPKDSAHLANTTGWVSFRVTS